MSINTTFFRFLKLAAVRHLGFLNFKFVTDQTRSRGPNCVTLQNFVEIAETAVDIWRFFDFSKWQPRHVGLLKLQISKCGTHHKCRIASPCQSSWRSRLNRCRDISILDFSSDGSHHLGFLKFYIFNDWNGQERRIASRCQILSKSFKPRRRYVGFRFFKMAAAAILDF